MPKRGGWLLLVTTETSTSRMVRNMPIRSIQRPVIPLDKIILSATIVAEDCMTADAYATTFMVLGVEKAKLLAQSNPPK